MHRLISFDNVTPMDGTFTHCTEASDIGLRPGEWPTSLAVDKKFGNGLELVRKSESHNEDGELIAVVYRQQFGVLEVHIIND